MTLTFTPISQLDLITTLENSDTLLLLDASTANQAGRVTLQVLADYLAIAATQIDWANILNKPITFPPSGHTHTKDQITDLSLGWTDITDKPITFPPSGHTHTKDQITDLSLGWTYITDKPITFPPSGHSHATTDITGLNSAIDARLGNLPNGAIIGGVAHFFQNTPPATRIDGSPLVIGDRLYKPNAQDYFYDGLRWLTCQAGGIAGRYTFVGSGEGFTTESSTLIGYEDLDRLWIEKIIFRYQLHTAGGIENSQNYWMAALFFRGSRNQNGSGFWAYGNYLPLDGISAPTPTNAPQKIIIPILAISSYCDVANTGSGMIKQGTVTSFLQASFTLITRGIHP